MAVMIPHEMESDNNSFGERQVFEALKGLPNDYTVFHSVRWNGINEKSTVVWGECDFTVFHPEKGILVIEVKSGGIACENGVWSYIRTDTRERFPMKNPLQQADRSKYRFLDILDDLFAGMTRPEDPQYCLVESAVWFPSISPRDIAGELPLEFRQEIVLYEDALKAPQRAIDSIYDFYGGYRHTRLGLAARQKILDAFAPHYNVLPSMRSKRLEQEDMFIRMTREQNSLLDYLEEQRVAAIQGSAGTGKTLLAVEKAKRLAADGKVLFLCFNQFLRQHLQEQKNDDPVHFANIDFRNLPQLACEKLRVPQVEKNDIHQFLSCFERYDWDYKHIVIDEGQDFDPEEIDKLYDIALLQDGAFYVFYDKNQFVQGREFPQWLQRAECRLILSTNCRNTYSIADTSGKPLHVSPVVKKKQVKGDMPQFFICPDEKAALRQITCLIDQYRSAGYAYEQICLLTVKTENTSIISSAGRMGMHPMSTSRVKNSIFFTTARKFKGLEADVVILVDVDESAFSNEENKRLFYVGASRAKHNLDIIFVGDTLQLEHIAEALNGKALPTAMIGLARGLSVKPRNVE